MLFGIVAQSPKNKKYRGIIYKIFISLNQVKNLNIYYRNKK